MHSLGLAEDDSANFSPVTASSFDWLRIAFGVVLLYDSWTSLSWSHKIEMSHFLACP